MIDKIKIKCIFPKNIASFIVQVLWCVVWSIMCICVGLGQYMGQNGSNCMCWQSYQNFNNF